MILINLYLRWEVRSPSERGHAEIPDGTQIRRDRVARCLPLLLLLRRDPGQEEENQRCDEERKDEEDPNLDGEGEEDGEAGWGGNVGFLKGENYIWKLLGR